MSQIEMTLRRAVKNLQHGQTKSVEIDASASGKLKSYVEMFARRNMIGVLVTCEGSKLIIKRISDLISKQRYGEMDGLAVGESHLFEIAIPEHAAVRRMASYRNRDGSGRAFRCTVDAGGMRVTRLPTTDAERSAMQPGSDAPRATKYGLEQLSTLNEIRFEMPRQEHQRLRMAVHKFGVKTGWTIRCRIQDDGSMLVYRTDAGAPAAAAHAVQHTIAAIAAIAAE